jgi:hypothetical protein
MKHSWNEEEQGRGIMADRFDLDAIESDDALLDLLAAGGDSARAAGEHDSAVQLLADLRLAVEVEDELPVETIDDPESFLARCAALNPIADPFARKVATRGLAFGVAAVAALSVSGVAAAVTGDPLSPYEKVIEKMVDAVRPQTSFPKEDLDGLPVVDRSKIVKVGKDFKEKARAERAAENRKDGSAGDDPQSLEIKGTPAVVVPPGDRPVAFPLPTDTQKTQDPVKPTTEVTPTPTDITTTDPTDTKTTAPTDTKTTAPTDTKTTDTPPDTPPSTPTGDPTDTTTPTPTPTPTDPTTTTTPATVDTGTGDSNTSTGDPTSTPSAGSGAGQSSDGSTTPSSDPTTPAGDSGGTGSPDTGSSDTSGSDTSGTGQTPGSEVTQVPAEVKQLVNVVEAIVSPVLPTPSGEPVTNQTAERFFGTPDATAKSVTTSKAPAKKAAAKKAVAKTQASGKHASGTVSTGSVRKAYPKGKHSSGAYPEGKHAAIARTHGSTTEASLLQILDVVNKPIM